MKLCEFWTPRVFVQCSECSFKKNETKLQSGLAFVQHCSTVRLGCIFEPLHMLERVHAHFKVNFNDYYSCTMLIQR